MTNRRRRLPSFAVVLLAVAVSACDSPPLIVNGWSVGSLTPQCAPDSCEMLIDLAESSIGPERAGRVVKATVHEQSWYPGEDGRKILATYGGPSPSIVLLEFDDGTRTAIGVGRQGISQTARVSGPGPMVNGALFSPSP
jgi:hypothetical protein